LGVIKRISAIR